MFDYAIFTMILSICVIGVYLVWIALKGASFGFVLCIITLIVLLALSG